MTTALATKPPSNPPAVADEIDHATLEMVVINGDLSKLNPQQRMSYYKMRCDAAGLDPRTQPFLYVTLSGKLTLYATKAAADQLVANRKLSVNIVDRKHLVDIGIFEVMCRVTHPDGQHVEDFAAVTVAGLKGEAFCNALMKTITKAKRRTILSACGLGLLDETEVETIPGAVRADAAAPATTRPRTEFSNHTGHGSGKYAAPTMVMAYTTWLNTYCEDINSQWNDYWMNKDTGEMPPGIHDLINHPRLSNHLCKWAREQKLIVAPEDFKVGQTDQLVAIAFGIQRDAVIDEANAYCRKLWGETRDKVNATLDAAEADTRKPANPDADDPDDAAFDEFEGEQVEAQAPPPDLSNAPRNGKRLFAWIKEQEKEHGEGLAGYLAGWLKERNMPTKMIDLDEEQCLAVYVEALNAIRTKQSD